jgi:hypothetical protein
MPKFKLRLTHTPKGANPHHPLTVDQRRAKGIISARDKFHVTGPGGGEHHITPEVDGATWIVEGEERDVDNMIRDWENPPKANVTIVKTPI